MNIGNIKAYDRGMALSTRVRVGKNGRIVIPAHLRRQLGIREGGALLARAEPGGRLILELTEARWAQLRSLFADTRPERSVVEELIEERHAEAAREA